MCVHIPEVGVNVVSIPEMNNHNRNITSLDKASLLFKINFKDQLTLIVNTMVADILVMHGIGLTHCPLDDVAVIFKSIMIKFIIQNNSLGTHWSQVNTTEPH